MTLYVYILASKPQGTLHVGVTNDLIRRVIEHKNEEIPGFTKRYNVKTLVYYEPFEDYQAAIAREKKLKRCRRDWKRSLIEETNVHWADLFPQLRRALLWVPDRTPTHPSGMTLLDNASERVRGDSFWIEVSAPTYSLSATALPQAGPRRRRQFRQDGWRPMGKRSRNRPRNCVKA